MKTLVLLAALFSANAFAGEKNLIYDCSNEDYIVRLYETETSNSATVTVKTDGDSYPTFNFRNIEMEQRRGKRFAGGPLVYKNSSFKMAISRIQGTKARIEVPEKAIYAVLRCH